MKLRVKALIVVLAAVAVVQAMFVFSLMLKIDTDKEVIALMRKNVDLQGQIVAVQEEYRMKTVELCGLRVRYGEAYRMMLSKLIKDLGLNDRPRSAAAILLKKMGYGIGGPE